MTDIVRTAARVAPLFADCKRFDMIAAEAILAGQALYQTAAGKAGKADANAAGKVKVIGIALNSAPAGSPVAVLKEGHVAGFTLTGVAYDGEVFLSDTVGELADAPGTTPVRVGKVMSITTPGLDKVLYIDCDWSNNQPKYAVFVSTEQTGTGAEQSIAHGLGVTPKFVMAAPTDTSPAVAGTYTITEGTHTSTNVVVTVTSGKKFKVLAFA